MQLYQMTTTNYTGTLLNMQYNYTAGQNNGRVSQTIDGVLGETVNYTYDMWNRLISATATNGTWGDTYTYDNFGNLIAKAPSVGSAPAMNVPANNSNQPAGSSVDANGNPTPNNTWDIENRLVGIYNGNLGQTTNYSYDPWGRRMWKEIPGYVDSQNNQISATTAEIYFYGVTGQKLETYSATYIGGGFVMSLEGINIYFGKKLLQSKGSWVATDKLGSVRYNSSMAPMSYFPYGEERENPNTANGVEKFGTYTRDAVGQDYAEQRYYNSSVGAFWSPDPGGVKTADPTNPNSWNRYAYVNGDPANHTDPNGTEQDSQCGPGWQFDPSLEGPCCDPSNQLLGAPLDPACYADTGGGTSQTAVGGGTDDPCDDIKQDISDTINGVGMPGGKSLLTRVVQQITGDPSLFDGHQEQIDNYRNRLRKLKRLWKKDDCPDPGDPPYNTNEWLKQTSPARLEELMNDYQQLTNDLKLIAQGAASFSVLRAVAQLVLEINEFLGSIGSAPILIPVLFP